MKRLLTIMVCLLAMISESLNAKAQEVTFLLRPGWNWIAYPYPESASIETAFGDFEPVSGDIIESEFEYSEYFEGYGWFGEIQNLEPGKGYIYYSNRTGPVTIVFGTPNSQSQVTVTTSEPMLITAVSAMCGGEVTTNDGTYILLKGICWATHPYPTTDDDYTENESGSGSFTAEITGLVPNTVYYVRAYAVSVKGIIYGDEQSFITNHEYVDLGLPSGNLWATCNVGADSPEDYGDYFAWGETQPKSNYNWSTYQYCNGSSNKLTKYCSNSSYGYNGFTDDLTNLLPGDDAATANWGDDWRMPTKEEWQELYDNTTCTWTTRNGVDGRLFTAANGKSVFLPAAGYRNGTSLSGSTGDYLSSTLYSNIPSRAWELSFGADNCSMSSYGHRKLGLSVRAVRGPVIHDYVDLGLPSGTLWATCNVGADTPEDYGDHFAWGETTPKSTYNWDTYQHCNGSASTLTKYCTNSSYGYNGFTDNLTTLLPEDDAATANWGEDWRMPVKEELEELYNNTTTTCTTQNGVYGTLFTATNGNSLFLPAEYRYSGELGDDPFGVYWSSSLNTDKPYDAWVLQNDWYWGDHMESDHGRAGVKSVRAVRSFSQDSSFVINVTAHPEEGGSVNGGGTYQTGTECTLTATPNEGYTFVCWMEYGYVATVSTELTYSFMVNRSRNLRAVFCNYVSGAYHYVDLGLPSGLLWATCNVGADIPEDYGDYFAWGETQPKDTYNWSTYQHCNGSENTLTKYCNNSSYGYNNFTDGLTTLLPEDDAASVNWGLEWRMPTEQEWWELKRNTTNFLTTLNGVDGCLFIAANGNTLFLPKADRRSGNGFDEWIVGNGYCWSNSLCGYDSRQAEYFEFGWDGFFSTWQGMENDWRFYGQSVRAVRSAR